MSETRPIVVVDTNCLNAEKSYSLLFGNRVELEKISKIADLLIPAVVVDEALEHKRRAFAQDVDRVMGSQVLRLCGVDPSTLEFPDFDGIEALLRGDQSIPYQIISPHDPAATFEKLYTLAVRHKPPFEEKTDKGFKDGCVAASVDDYLEDTPGVSVYLLTEDVRLASYFRANPRVTHVASYKELFSHIESGDQKEAAGPSTGSGKTEQTGSSVSTTTDPKIVADLLRLTEELSVSGSFSRTHSVIKKLRQLQGSIGRKEGIGLLRAAVHNDQVYEIIKDDDVWDYLYPLFRRFEDELDDDEYAVFVEHGDLPYERDEDPLNVHFSISERRVFSQVVNAVGDHLASVGALASPYSPSEIVDNFERLLSRNQLSRTINCRDLIAAIVNGQYSAYDGAILTDTLRDFLNYYRRAGGIKREAVVSGLTNKVEEADIDFTDTPF